MHLHAQVDAADSPNDRAERRKEHLRNAFNATFNQHEQYKMYFRLVEGLVRLSEDMEDPNNFQIQIYEQIENSLFMLKEYGDISL